MLKSLDTLENSPTYYTRTDAEIEMTQIENSSSGDFKVGVKLTCVIYLLKNFRKELLDLPCLTTYVDPSQRYIKP